MTETRSSRKKQTRLAFTPLPSSSPAAKDYHKQIQDRAAAVTLTGSTKRRKVLDDDDEIAVGNAQLDGVNDSIPTPAASNQQIWQTITNDSDSESEAIRSGQRQQSVQMAAKGARARNRQQRLDFSNRRDHDSFSSPIRLSSPLKTQSSSRAGMFGTQTEKAVTISSDDNDDSVNELPSPARLMATRKLKKPDSNARVTRSTQPIAVDSESEGDNIVVSSTQKPSKAIQIESENDEDEDDMPTTVGTQRRKRARAKSRDSFIASSPPNVVESDDDLEIIEKPKKKSHRRRRDDTDDDDAAQEEANEEPVTPVGRKLKRRRPSSRREQEDLEEDLDFLGPSSDVDSARKPRDTQSLQKNARQKALERLKRRRSGQIGETELTVDDGDEGHRQNGDESDDSNHIDNNTSEEEEPRIMKISQMFREDEEDDAFIDSDDEGDPLGIPEGIPLEYTRYASMKPKELFKYAVEWMVQKKINPAFQIDDPIYDLTFRKLNDETQGLASSKFKSAAWNQQFTVALSSRPRIDPKPSACKDDDSLFRDHCQACNRSGHPATFEVRFSGKPYHAETLEELTGNDDDDSSNDTDEDEPDYDSAGREVPPAGTVYYVGQVCMANAESAHALTHWRYHLYEWVVEWLDNNGYLSPNEIVERDGWSTKKRSKYANKITDRLVAEGEVKQLYENYKESLDKARESKGRWYGKSM